MSDKDINGLTREDWAVTDEERQAIERLTRHPVRDVWIAAQDLGNALGLWNEED